MMRPVLATTLLATLAITSLGCGDTAKRPDNDKINVVASILPLGDLVKQVGGDMVVVSVLVGPDQSPSTYEPSARQMALLGSADVFFKVGVPFESVLVPKVKGARPDLPIIDVNSPDKVENATKHSHASDHESEDDPHTWLDPILAKGMAEKVRDTLAKLDPAHQDGFTNNFIILTQRLDALDKALETQLIPLAGSRVHVFHPSFGHLLQRYGLIQVAVEHHGKGPGPRHLAEVTARARTEGVKHFFIQPQFPQHSVKAVAREVGAKIVPLDPLPAHLVEGIKAIGDTLESVLGRKI